MIFVTDVSRLLMKTKYKINLAIILTLFTFFFDQLTKYIVIQNIDVLSKNVEIFSGIKLVYVENKGIGFGIFSELDIPFYLGILSFVISFYIILLIVKSSSILEIVSLSFILGGALGNGIDRLFVGYVIDFIDIYYGEFHWPAFNLADSFITVGAFLFVLYAVKKKKN